VYQVLCWDQKFNDKELWESGNIEVRNTIIMEYNLGIDADCYEFEIDGKHCFIKLAKVVMEY